MSEAKRVLVIVSLLALAGFGEALSAQRGRGGGGLGLNGLGPRMGENVALAVDLRGELGLSSEQLQALRTLGDEIAVELGPLESDIDALRESVWAGEIPWTEGVNQLQGAYDRYQTDAEPYRSAMAEILTEEQHLLLQAAMFDSRIPYGRGLGVGGGYSAGVGLRYGGGVGLGYGPGRGVRLGLGVGYGATRGWGAGRGLSPAGRRYLRAGPRGGGWYRWR